MPAFITIYGNLGRDAEVRSTASGDTMVSFSVAVSHWNAKERSETTSWFRVSVFGRYAETFKELRKGDVVLVNGDLELREFAAQDGTKRMSAEIIARTVKDISRQMRSRMGGGAQGGAEHASEAPPSQGGWTQAPRAARPEPKTQQTEDDLPF
ncbi:MAG: single-stranded DNA-binding protein [Candidatus Sumerlaeia bacterium]|nr:single-stranded DNA-binding protein [Candidatus Sumerlaeia bacterium]